ncbi:MAG: hypothetical protein WD824_13155 [Cyclobacteriaceae bacterium]
MKRCLTVLLCFYLVNIAYGQGPYAEVKLKSNNIDEIQAFEVHDSVFLTYTDKDIRKAFWINGGGKTTQVYLNHVGEIRICGIQKQPDTTFLYYLKEEDKFLRLYALKQESHGGNIYSGGKPVTIFGDLMAIHADDGEFIMVSYIKQANRLEIISLHRGIKTGFVDSQMPEDFNRFASSSGLITNNGMTAISQGSALTKIYKEGRSMVLTIDENRVAVGKSVTKIIKIDVSTGNRVLYTIPGPDRDKFRSFYHDGKLFQFITDPIYEWVVYDIETGVTLYTKKLKQEKSLRNQKVVVRTESPEVLSGSLNRMMGL